MNQILYQDDHLARAKALSKAYPGTMMMQIVKKDNKIVIDAVGRTNMRTGEGIDTLIFWGHGTNWSMCGMDAPTFIECVSAWKKMNKTLTTVEIITCNARHAEGGGKSFTEQILAPLKKKHKDIVVKALPKGIGRSGNAQGASILMFGTESNQWYYVSAKTDFDMHAANRKVMDEVKKLGIKLELLADAAKNVEKELGWKREFGLMYGSLNTLRSKLVVLKG